MKFFFLPVLTVLFIVGCTTISQVHAHEAYVLTPQQFQAGLQVNSTNPLAPLFYPQYVVSCAIITIGLFVVYALNFLFATTKMAANLDKQLKKLSGMGLLAVRLAICASFLYGALGNNIFGPELSLAHIPGGQAILYLKVAVGILLGLGLFTRLAAFTGVLIFLYMYIQIGPYLLTYLNYLGELIALSFFGSWFLSADAVLFQKGKPLQILSKYKEWEVPIIRSFYGLALIYASISIKFMHQSIPIEVVNTYHLERYFHASADFIAAGAGMSELAIGFFILIGFAQRLTVFISLVFITLSLLFFREAVWPHLMLYGIGIMIFINSGDKLTVDRYLPSLIKKLSLFKNHS